MTLEQGACEFPQENATPEDIAQILKEMRTIAVVGLSPKPIRPSYGVAAYLKTQGYQILPVNPGHSTLLGETAYPSLLDVPMSVDVVDIFRKPEAILEIVEQAIKKKAQVIWMQEGIVHNEAAHVARRAGLKVVMNKCLLKEHQAWATHFKKP